MLGMGVSVVHRGVLKWVARGGVEDQEGPTMWRGPCGQLVKMEQGVQSSSLLVPTDLAPLFCSQVGPIEATSFTLRVVRPQARYCIQVAAQDLTDYGEMSDWSLPAAASKPMGK